MLVVRNSYGYSNKKKYIQGQGFVDVLKSVGNYLVENKDLIAKPILGAVGSLAATGLSAGVPALINYIAKRNRKNDAQHSAVQPIMQPMAVQTQQPQETSTPAVENAKYKEILENILKSPSTGPVVGSGLKHF